MSFVTAPCRQVFRILGCCVVGASMAATSTAAAAEGGDPSPPPPNLEPPRATPPAAPVAVPPPPPARDQVESTAPPSPVVDQPALPIVEELTTFGRTGFYLRLNVGVGYGAAAVQTNRVSAPNLRLAGFGGDLRLLAGWTPWPGLALGSALGLSTVRSNRAHVDNERVRADGTITTLSAFVDAHPNLRRGEHFGGELGVAIANVRSDEPRTRFQGGGLGLGLFFGKDWAFARRWSLGALLRLGATWTRQDVSSVLSKQGIAYGATLSATVLYR